MTRLEVRRDDVHICSRSGARPRCSDVSAHGGCGSLRRQPLLRAAPRGGDRREPEHLAGGDRQRLDGDAGGLRPRHDHARAPGRWPRTSARHCGDLARFSPRAAAARQRAHRADARRQQPVCRHDVVGAADDPALRRQHGARAGARPRRRHDHVGAAHRHLVVTRGERCPRRDPRLAARLCARRRLDARAGGRSSPRLADADADGGPWLG